MKETLYINIYTFSTAETLPAKCNHAPMQRDDKRKADAPSLSSWTLCLQAALVSGGWHPLFPEQVGGDLEKNDVSGHPQTAESPLKRNSVKLIPAPRNRADSKSRHAVKRRCGKKGNADDVSSVRCVLVYIM